MRTLPAIMLSVALLASELPLGEAADTGTQPFAAKAKSWWAFRPLNQPRVPDIGSPTPIDAFLDQKIVAAGLEKSPPADPRTLLRRVYFDLVGLPPSSEEVIAFEKECSKEREPGTRNPGTRIQEVGISANGSVSSSPSAFERAVDRLLASPAYGERYARHWLDVARYADYHDADPKARVASCEPLEAWRYRDWVVDSFNADLPFDRFIVHQIAGDLLPAPAGEPLYAPGLIATGFLLNGVWDRGDADKEKLVSDMVDDQVDTVGKAFLGLTLGCARCHDHKFDPVSNQDYYALAGIFYSTHIMEALGTKGGEITLKRTPLVAPSVAAARDGLILQLDAVKAKLAALAAVKPPVAADHPERLRLLHERDTLQAAIPSPYPVALSVQDGGMPGGLFPNLQDVPIHIRGSYTRLGPVVPRRMPEFFAGESQPRITQGSGRRELAAWIASTNNPLTARVIVNRVWQWHFGEGLVRTPNNFGLNSEPPSHPELLDWLASKFVEDGWSLKKLHRRIVLSAAYQRASKVALNQVNRDPENRWLARFSPRRLEAEVIRDAMLDVSAQLDASMTGPAGADLSAPRRSLYVQTARWDRSNFASLFDAANPDASVDRRSTSTVAPQALFMINHEFVIAQAERIAHRLLRESPADETARIHSAYRTVLARPAREEELAIARRLLAETNELDASAPWRDLAHVLLCSNEFIYVD